MRALTCLLVLAGLLGCVGSPLPRPAAAPGATPAAAPGALSLEERAAILHAVWQRRSDMIADGARLEARGVYLLFDRDPAFRTRLERPLQALAAGDTGVAPPRTEAESFAQRLWRLWEMHVVPDGEVIVWARVSHGSEHFERYRVHHQSGMRWTISEITLSHFIYY